MERRAVSIKPKAKHRNADEREAGGSAGEKAARGASQKTIQRREPDTSAEAKQTPPERAAGSRPESKAGATAGRNAEHEAAPLTCLCVLPCPPALTAAFLPLLSAGHPGLCFALCDAVSRALPFAATRPPDGVCYSAAGREAPDARYRRCLRNTRARVLSPC